jgi:hypothetical protein
MSHDPEGCSWGSVYLSAYDVCQIGHVVRDNIQYPQTGHLRRYPEGGAFAGAART